MNQHPPTPSNEGGDTGPLPDVLAGTQALARVDVSFNSGRYVVRHILGGGAQKVVYLVHDETLDRDCALAMIRGESLDQHDVERLRREAQAMARLGAHSNVVTVFDVGEDRGLPYLVCEYVPGGELRDELRAADGPLSVERALAIAADLCRALEVAHARSVIHRDVKPANVWLCQDGSVKLGDFGLAFSNDRSRLTMIGTVMGTAHYMAPELALGQPATEQSDLYALGCVLYEMITGAVPFRGSDVVSVVTQHLETPPVAPSWQNPEISPALDELIRRLLAKSPTERPVSARAVLDAIAALSNTSGVVQGVSEPQPRSTSLDRLASGVFVGREAEVRLLRDAFNDSLSGHARIVLLVGEPGIGKTRTTAELCTYARLRGADVLIGRCYEGEGAPAYWPWVQAIRSYVSESAVDELRADMARGAADIAQIVPELHERLTGLEPPPKVEPEQARFHLFDSITTFLKNASRRRPLVLVLDDVHWADKASLVMLQFLARDLKNERLLVLATYRDVELGRQHPLAQTLGELAREQIGTRVLLRGLGETDVTRYLSMTAGIEPSDSLVAAVFRETEGNPFFLTEVVRLLVADEQLQEAGDTGSWRLTIPQSVREVVGRRLDHLSEECNGALTMAAVIGREFGLDALQILTKQTPGRLLDLVEEARASRVVEEVGDRVVGRFSFSHALIRETLYDELSTTRRVRLHLQVGEALESLYAANVDAHLSELAYHFGEAATLAQVEKVVGYSERAARQAHSVAAFEEAIEHYRRALAALELLPTRDREREFELLLLLEQSQRPRAPDEARLTCLSARDIGRECQNPEMVARATISHEYALEAAGWLLGFSDDDVQQHQKLVEEALAALSPEDGRERCLLLGHLASLTARGVRPLPSESDGMIQEAVAMARRIDDPDTLLEVLSYRHSLLSLPLDLPVRLRLDDEMTSLAASLNDIGRRLDANEHLLADLLELGDIASVDEALAKYVELDNDSRWPQARFWIAIRQTMRALFSGRFSDAERLLADAAVNSKWSDEGDAAAQMGVPLYLIRREQGRLAEIQGALETFAVRYDHFPAWRAGLTLLYAEVGNREAASREFDWLARDDFTHLPTDSNLLLAMSLLSDVCMYLDDRSRAKALYARLRPFANWNVTGLDGVIALGSASRALGLLATVLESYSDAERHFQDALVMNERMGARPWVAYTQYDYARMLLARGAQRDRAQATELLAEAAATATALDMTALQAKIAAAQA